MRIVLVNWAKIWDGASNGGGVNGYCQALALALMDRGHEVVSLFGGTTHLRSPTACMIRRHDDWLGVKVFEVVNSPVLAPSIQQFQDPMGEVSAPELEARVGELFAMLKPDVVHWHNIEGFSIGCVEQAKNSGARVVFSLHNYHCVCPQVYLMKRHRDVCHDFDNGHACRDCIETNPTAVERERRIEGYEKFVGIPRGGSATDEERFASAVAELRSGLSWMKRTVVGAARMAASAPAMVRSRLMGGSVHDAERAGPPPPGAGVATGEDVASARPAAGRDTRGQTERLAAERAARESGVGGDASSCAERRPLLNVITPEPASSKPANEYARRRAAMVKMLGGCDRVLAVSDFVRRKFVSMGVPEGVIGTLAIGSRINELVARNRTLVFDPPPFGSQQPGCRRPIRLVFMGYNHYYKGLGMFAEALELLGAEQLRHIDLSVYALDGGSIEWMFRRMEPRLARLTFVPGYQYSDIPWMLGGKDLGVVCSVWWDNAPQTVFEFFACGVPVLGAEVGGIPDFVKDGVNGLLFRGNDRRHLADRLAEVITDPVRLDVLRRGVRPPKDIAVHAAELEAVYTEVGRGP